MRNKITFFAIAVLAITAFLSAPELCVQGNKSPPSWETEAWKEFFIVYRFRAYRCRSRSLRDHSQIGT